MENDNDNTKLRVIDLTEWDNGKPHWLSPQGRRPNIFERVRAKSRAKHKAERDAQIAARKAAKLAAAPKEQTVGDYWVSLGMRNVTGTGRGFTIGTGGPVAKKDDEAK